jgi:hypothetical protein
MYGMPVALAEFEAAPVDHLRDGDALQAPPGRFAMV